LNTLVTTVVNVEDEAVVVSVVVAVVSDKDILADDVEEAGCEEELVLDWAATRPDRSDSERTLSKVQTLSGRILYCGE
jgi:hypothetical protein